jgi:hypothetical protein
VFEKALIIGRSSFSDYMPDAFFEGTSGIVAPKTDAVLF